MGAPRGPRNIPPENRCNAKPRPGGPRKEPCKNPKVLGQKRCAMHGGRNSTTEQRRNEIKAERKLKPRIQAALRQLNIQPVEDPLTALKEMAGEVLAWKDEMRRHVLRLDQLRYRGENAEQTRAEIVLYERAMDRCTSVLATIAKLNIDDRLAAITERQAEMLERGMLAAFEAAGIPVTEQETRMRVAHEFGKHLQLVS